MKVLVTGSNGFIGRYLVRELRARGFEVEGFDLGYGNNILDLVEVKRAVKGKQAVFHLAAVLDETKPKEMLEVNVVGTENVVEASAKAGVEHFVFLSTVGVHGNSFGIVGENSPIRPETMYETSKARAEKIVWDSQEMLPVTILRSALVLGPNSYWCNIIRLVEKGFPLIGSGNNRFQTISVKDLVSALAFVLGKKDCFGETYIVAGNECPTLRELYGLIQKELRVKQRIRSVPVWVGKTIGFFSLAKAKVFGKKTVVLPQHVLRLTRERCYDTRKIRALGWQPRQPLEETIRKTVRACKKK